MENKEKKKARVGFKKFVSNNLNAIAIALLAFGNVILSVFTVADGEVNLRPLPHTAIGWILWLVSTFAPAAIAVLIFQMFRQSGIAVAHREPHLKEAREEYLKLMAAKEKECKAISEKEYYKKGIKKDLAVKLPISILTSFLVFGLAMTFNFSALVGIVFQTALILGFGFNTKASAKKYACEELFVWYGQEVKRLTEEQGVSEKIEPTSEAVENIPEVELGNN